MTTKDKNNSLSANTRAQTDNSLDHHTVNKPRTSDIILMMSSIAKHVGSVTTGPAISRPDISS